MKCLYCGGTGEVYGQRCPQCLGTKVAQGATEVAQSMIVALEAKVDAIKAMLDSAVYGMQKMSSNLDDIMVKLDV